MTKTECLIVAAGVVLAALLLIACLLGQQVEKTNAVAGSVDVLRGEVMRLQMELDTLRHVRVELTVVDKTMRVVDVVEVAK